MSSFRDHKRVDGQAQEFIEFLCEEGEGQSLAADVLSAIQHYQPSMRRCLNGSWRLFKTWQRFEIPAGPPPMTWQIVQIPMRFLHHQSLQVALSLGVAFRCLLRTGELLSLQARDIVIPAGSRCAILCLGETETGPRNPHTGTVSCHDSTLVHLKLLQVWKATCDPQAFLVPWPQSRFRSTFNAALSSLELQSNTYKPYSLRRGGALTCHTGRWSAERTVKVYIQDSIALLTQLTFKPSQKHMTFLRHWEEVTRRAVLSHD